MSEFDEDRIVVALGERPEAGDLSAGQTLPAYRELARVQEPWLEPLMVWRKTSPDEPPHDYSDLRFTEEEARRWWRRFLD